jgi:sulfate adenylyltransferase
MLAVLPLAKRMGGPREALRHALIRQNHGATHFIVGRDHAGPRPGTSGTPFYAPYEAQELVRRHQDELDIQVVGFRRMVYLQQAAAYVEEHEAPVGQPVSQISGTELRRRLLEGEDIPDWFTFPEVARELRRRYRPRAVQGFTVLISGLPGAGKSAIAGALVEMLSSLTERSITLLDGDEARHVLSPELGYSKADRERHVLRAAYVATEVTKSGGAVVCAQIAPYAANRRDARRLIEPWGGFLLVHAKTPLHLCEALDRKGLYAKARAGLVSHFTGVSDSYEVPADADLVVDGAALTPHQSALRIVEALRGKGFLPSGAYASADAAQEGYRGGSATKAS